MPMVSVAQSWQCNLFTRFSLDLNFLLRVSLWPPERRDSPASLGIAARGIPVADLHELAGLDLKKLRLAFVLYGAMSRRDWRTVSAEEIALDPRDASQRLFPLLRADLAPARAAAEDWCTELVARCRRQLAMILPWETAEHDFLDRINGRGEIRPELLTGDPEMQERIVTHPALLWKAHNARAFAGRQDPREN